jgi:hypothetical protein
VARPCRLACLVVSSRYSRRSSLPIDNHARMSKAKRYKAEDKASKVRHHSICAFLYTERWDQSLQKVVEMSVLPFRVSLCFLFPNGPTFPPILS